MTKTALIVGATGVVGNAALEHLLEHGWECIAVSRRPPATLRPEPFTHVPLDLSDQDACAAAAPALAAVTHVVYAALYEKPGLIAGWTETDQIERNDRMLRNLVGALHTANAPLEQIALLQGTKAYGMHLAPMKIPGKERQPRVEHPNFYWQQEDFIRAESEQHGFATTIFRPQFVFGGAISAAMNLVPAIGAYAAIRKEEGEPFTFPGGPSYVAEAADARLLASAMRWAFTSPASRNETFNITNGDVFEWRNVWSTLAGDLGIEPGDEAPLQLTPWFETKADVWDAVTAKHGLQPIPLLEYLGESRYFLDFAFAFGADARDSSPAFVSTVKLRQAGFTEVYDTEDAFAHWFDHLRRRRLLPPIE